MTMEDESWRDGSLAQRILCVLDSELMADCTFVVGIAEKKEFQCHKFVLSLGSPVFYAMFNGGLEEKGEVKVEDIEPQHFRKVLEFIYSDDTELESVESALNVCYAANKYMIDKLALKCTNYIKDKLDEDTVCRTLEFARLVNNADLEAESLQFLQIHTSDVLQSASFLHAERATLLTILMSQDDLCISSDVELFSACIRWAKANQYAADDALRDVLGPEVLSLIRFLAMTAQEFATTVVPSKLLGAHEERDILCCIVTESEQMPLGFNNNTATRVNFKGPRETIKIQSNGYLHGLDGAMLNSHPFNFTLNVESVIFGLQLRGLDNGSSILDCFVVDLLLASKLLASAKFVGIMSVGKPVEVNFKKPIRLQANTNYTLQIRYSNTTTKYITYCIRQKLQTDCITNSGVKLNACYTFTTISKIYVAKQNLE